MYNLVVLAVEMFRPTASSSLVPQFKIYLVPDDDYSLTGNLDLKENINWWWVDLKSFSKAYFEDKAREDARRAEADAARAADEPEPAPPPPTYAEKRATAFTQLFKKIPGKLKDNPGNYYACTVEGCEKGFDDPYFVGAGECSLSVTYSSTFFLTCVVVYFADLITYVTFCPSQTFFSPFFSVAK